MRDDVRDNCLRVLGLAPGASAQEIKAAYRDLAKVWHPDRFAHDPRLQQKAQAQLKEINEAYQRLVSGDFAKPHARPRASAPHEPRAASAPPRAHTSTTAHEGMRETHAPATAADERVATRTNRGISRVALAAPALAFCATFAFVTPRLLSTGRAPERPDDAATTSAAARVEHVEPARQSADPAAAQAEAADARAQQKTQTANQAARPQPINHAESATAAAAAQPLRAMPTVTISVDPTTGLRARAGCPHKSAMTFPAGDEPTAYCDAHNATTTTQRAASADAPAGRAGDPRGKSFAGRITSSAKKLFGGGRSPDKEPARDKNVPHN